MPIVALDITTLCLYLAGAIAQATTAVAPFRFGKVVFFALGISAVGFHAALLHRWIDLPIGQNLSFFNMLSLVVWVVAVLILIVAARKPVENLAIIVFPTAALSLLLTQAFPQAQIVDTLAAPGALFHILLGALTFGVLCMAALQAAFLAWQERRLRLRARLRVDSSGFLPPLETMESLLFGMVWVGFALLGAMLITSLSFFFDDLITRYLLRKILLVSVAWCVFAVLLAGRYLLGWRGRKAIYGTLVGVLLLVPAYFGSQWLLDALL